MTKNNDGLAKKFGDVGFFHMLERMMVTIEGEKEQVVCHGTFGSQLLLSSSKWEGIKMVDIDNIVCRPFHPIFASFMSGDRSPETLQECWSWAGQPQDHLYVDWDMMYMSEMEAICMDGLQEEDYPLNCEADWGK